MEGQSQKPSQQNQEPESQTSGERSGDPRPQRPRVQCHACHRFGHIASQCRNKDRWRRRAEAAGRSNDSTSTALATTAELTDEQLEQELTRRRLNKEQQMLKNTSTVGLVTAGAVGPTMFMDVAVEGFLVSAVVDVGSQSTIISRSLLHSIKSHLQSEGKATPRLDLPGLTLYGKSGSGRSPVDITAWVNLTFAADGKAVNAPVFVQPHSEQD